MFKIWLVGEARKHIFAVDFRSWNETIVNQMSQRL